MISDFEGLFNAHYAAVTRVIYRVVGDVGMAEELAAEAFWKLHRDPPAGWQPNAAAALEQFRERAEVKCPSWPAWAAAAAARLGRAHAPLRSRFG